MRAESRRFKEPLSTKIQNKPELFMGLALFLNAWFDLDTERDRTKFRRITRSMCFQYAVDYDLDEEQKDDLWYFINAMDQEFLSWWMKRQPKNKGAGNKGGKRVARSG